MSDLRPRTIWIAEADGWRHCPLHDGTQTVGRDMSCGIVIQHERISRRHAQIECCPEGTYLSDLGSANGVLRNGAPLLGRTRLLPGDRVLLGPVELRIGEQEDVFAAPIAAPTAGNSSAASTAAASADTPGSKRIRHATRRRSLVPLLAAACLLGFGAWGLWQSGVLSNLPINPNLERPLEELVPSEISQAGRADCAAAFEAALAAARYEEAESLALSPEAAPELAPRLRQALDTLVHDLKQDADAIARNGGPAKAAAHLRAALEGLPRGSGARRALDASVRAHALHAEELETAAAEPAPVAVAIPATELVKKDELPESVAAGAATAEDAAAATKAWAQRDLQEARRLAGTIIAGRSAPAVRRAAERVLRCVEDHELLADALATGLEKVPERRWPNQTSTAVLRASRSGLAAQTATGVSSLPWKVVSADLMAAAVQAAALDPTAQAAAARVLRELGHAEAADALLAKALLRDTTLHPRIDRILADGLDLAEVPPGGFVWLTNAWITAADAARRVRREDLDKDAGLLASNKPEVREEALARLLSLGDAAKASLRRGLLQARAQVLLELRKQNGFDALETLVVQRTELDKVRAHAMDLIFDTTLYPYPYRPPEADATAQANYRLNQPEVDRRVQAVRALWDAAKPVPVQPGVRKLVARFEELGVMAQRADITFEDEFAWLLLLPAGRDTSLHDIALHPKDRERIDASTETLKSNNSAPGVASIGEREQCRITNEYRVMMGCWAVRLYDRLTRASRGHCADMTRLGFFAHDSPVDGKHTPMDRVTREGMQPEGCSENIAISGGAAAAHAAWTRSPGHHRNILMPAWRLMGPGNNGRHWCQNFSIRDRAPAEEAGR